MAELGVLDRGAAKRDQMRAAAQHLFLLHGYAGTSMDAVTAEAGVSKQTLYRYYPSKETLFADVVQQLLRTRPPGSLVPDVGHRPLTSRAELEAALLALAQALVANAMQPAYLALLRVIVAETPRAPHLAALVRVAVAERGGATIRDLLGHAEAQGLVVMPDRDAAARLFAGSLLTYILGDGLFAPDGVPHPPAPARLAALVRLFLRAVATS